MDTEREPGKQLWVRAKLHSQHRTLFLPPFFLPLRFYIAPTSHSAVPTHSGLKAFLPHSYKHSSEESICEWSFHI